mmetsp:Transcript_72946/g.152287  ORF Transcript_72946/g.152287 Transcript_72946/m.152287 type:complete len:698 (-) Transcript_72946:252-2345(-)
MMASSSWAVAAAVMASSSWIGAAENIHGLGCTAVAVDGSASPDGSAYAGMNADCSSCDSRITWVPARSNGKNAKRSLYVFSGENPRFVGYGRGKFYEPTEGQNLTEPIGSIPDLEETFGYWEATLPLMNEKGLALGESSCAARLLNYPKGMAPPDGNPRTGEPALEGLLDISNLMQLALERCETARCGVETMGKLADEHGFFPMVGEWSLGVEASGIVAFDDGGESVTLADKKGEAWVFHVVGGVEGFSKSLWAAMRLPKGHAAFIANNFILRELPAEPTEDWLFTDNIHEAAKKSGLWDGRGALDFSRVFAPDTVTFQSPPGEAPIPLYASLRQWRLLSVAAPEAMEGRRLPLDPLTLPTSVKVEYTMRPTEVFAFLSDIYQGTEFDLTQGILAGPFGNPFRLEGGNASLMGQIPRGISIPRTAYSTIGQSRATGEPVLWFAQDTPVSSVYVPFYPSVGDHRAPAYSKGTLLEFSRDSAFWAFDFVSNWVSLQNWRHANDNFLVPVRTALYSEIAAGMAKAEADSAVHGKKALADFQVNMQQRVVDRWWHLADDLIVAYNDGFFNNASSNKAGLSLGYPAWFAKDIGFNEDVHPIYIRRDYGFDRRCEADVASCPPDFRAIGSPLPGGYDFSQAQWLFEQPQELAEQPVSGGFWSAQALLQLIVCTLLMAASFAFGRLFERRREGAERRSAYLLMA